MATKTSKPETVPVPGAATVLISFRDKDNFDLVYEVGDDVSHFDKARKADCAEKGLIEVTPVA